MRTARAELNHTGQNYVLLFWLRLLLDPSQNLFFFFFFDNRDRCKIRESSINNQLGMTGYDEKQN